MSYFFIVLVKVGSFYYNINMNKETNLSRIEELATFISPYKVIADVGCDHGYLVIEAFEKAGVTKAYAIDNKLMGLAAKA